MECSPWPPDYKPPRLLRNKGALDFLVLYAGSGDAFRSSRRLPLLTQPPRRREPSRIKSTFGSMGPKNEGFVTSNETARRVRIANTIPTVFPK